MVERYHEEPLPPAYPVRYGSPRLPDGQGVPNTPPPPTPLSVWWRVAYWGVLAVLAGALILGWVQ